MKGKQIILLALLQPKALEHLLNMYGVLANTSQNRIIHNEIPDQPWDKVGASIYTLINSHFLCITDYHSKFPAVEQAERLSAGKLVRYCKIIFTEYGLSCKITLDAGTNFLSDKLEDICKKLNIDHTDSSCFFVIQPPK